MIPVAQDVLASPAQPAVLATSVVVVTWNGLDVLVPCLAALAAQTLPHELIIVDNGSHDGTVEWVKAHAPEARLIALPQNTGFAGGNNAGIAAATGDLVVLINNDTLAAPDALAHMTAPFASRPALGATAGVLTFAHRPELIASAGIVVSRDGVHRDAWAMQPVSALPAQPTPIFGASGGAVCYRRAALDDVGLLDPHFFAYLEDADLAWRLRLRGWESLLTPNALIKHIYSATSGQGSPFKQRLLARNRWWLMLRCWPRALLARCAFSMLRYDLQAIGFALLKRQPAIIQGRLAAWRDLPRLGAERKAIQGRRTARLTELAAWVNPPLSIRQTLNEARALDAVLRQRSA